MTVLRDQLIALIEPVLTGIGYELVDLEFVTGRPAGTLRVFIDRLPSAGTAEVPEDGQADGPADGITPIGVEDCVRASHAVSELLDVADPISTAYSLEMSSPGFDRRLRTRAHFERFVGERVHVELAVPRDGRRRYTGRLEAVVESEIRLEVDQEQVALPLAGIEKARLAP